MSSSNATLNHEREYSQRYAHQGPAGNSNYYNVLKWNVRADTRHLPDGDTPRRLGGEDGASQASRSEQEQGNETLMSNGDVLHSQYDSCYESGDFSLQSSSRKMDRGPGQGRNDYDNDYDFLYRILVLPAKANWPFQEEMTCIDKRNKWEHYYYGPCNDEPPGRNGQCNLKKAERQSKRGQCGIFCGRTGDKDCTGPSWFLPCNGRPSKPTGCTPYGPDHYYYDYTNRWDKQQFDKPNGPNADGPYSSLRVGHGADVESHDSPSAHYQPTVRDDPGVDPYRDRVEHSESSKAAETRQQGTDDGLNHFRARLAAVRVEEEEAEASFKAYLEALRQEREAIEESHAIERILRQERADLERRDAQRTTS
ncbi:hypothetical protein E8E12_003602 [Didymella heteroderae]|uniref:Uncharacterized protein n=1 Tax=Didymella heteroderae TaxID=1769908 RepID=A0A9P5BX15_9PLEO|nr:hypothetical protein E8E12_003602 [Didymella heteroderae]